MAERRMFAKTIIDSDAFLEMPMSARLLYYDLSMRADDDGFNNSPRKVMRAIGATTDDMNILIARKFIIPFESGVIVIKHWKIHNYIRKDTYKATNYKEEKALLEYDENNAYRLADTSRRRAVDEPSTQVSLGKGSIVQDNILVVSENGNTLPDEDIKPEPQKRFKAPTLEEVKAYCQERKNGIDPERFIDYYTAKGWKIGKQPMKDWKAAVRTWEKNHFNDKQTPAAPQETNPGFDEWMNNFMQEGSE